MDLTPTSATSIDAAPSRYGRMTPQRWIAEGHGRADHRVWANGWDITDDCVEFDDQAGTVVLLRKDRYGRRGDLVTLHTQDVRIVDPQGRTVLPGV